ncbi:MAG: ATP phosphoribosyltransferase regulatory subunit [Clostridia bacterium]|nr:ATP phosphoribosyltransferase regulatory subunit [Clostridia bacterium]
MDKILRVLKPDEILKLKLRSIYEEHGYRMYRMNCFEEYGFYLENKNFLLSDSVITFTDLDGRLLALKPDVTLSIVKHADGNDMKLYYTENVYRPDRNKRSFKEIAQIGLEHIGRLDCENVCQVVALAAKSLKEVSENSILEIGHCGFVGTLLKKYSPDMGFAKEMLALISQKNVSDIKKLCDSTFLSEEAFNIFVSLPSLHGDAETVIDRARKLCVNTEIEASINELETICKELNKQNGICNVKLDLSLIGEEEYYNGVIFSGYVKGVPARVLSGGRYDALLEKLGKDCSAIGFALYFDELEQFYSNIGGNC